MTGDWERYLAVPGHRRIDGDAAAHDERRDAVFRSVFGTAPFVFTLPHATPPGPLDVLLFDAPAPNELPLIVVPGALGQRAPGQSARSFATLVTSGASNQRMAYPEGTPRRFLRIELAMYLDKDAARDNPDLTHFCSDVLMHYAKQPFVDDTFLLVGMVLPIVALGQGQVSFLGDPSITALVVAPPPDDSPEAKLRSELVLDGDAVGLFCLLPLTAEQERIARMDLGVHGAIRSFEAFAERARLEPVYRGPVKRNPAAASGQVGKLARQIRVPPPSQQQATSEPRSTWMAPLVMAPGIDRDAAGGTDEVRRPKVLATTPAATPKTTTAAPTAKRTATTKRRKAKAKANATPKADRLPPPTKPWWKFWA